MTAASASSHNIAVRPSAHLEVRGLIKDFGTTRALHGVDFEARPGRLVCLLGPSGCGKTTLLRMIAGIAEPTEGEISVNGRRIDAIAPETRNFGMVFQTYALFPHMSVRRNVGFGLDMRRTPKAVARQRIDAALQLVGLAHLADRLPRQLSGGQQQRVALARAIVIEPDLLLFDEPLSNLDARLRDDLREELRALQTKLGITSIYVTHDQSEAMAMADEIVVMRGGRIVERGAPVDLYRRPATRFTADFLGLTNVLRIDLRRGVARLPWGEERQVSNWADQPQNGLATVAIRPEDLTVTADADGPAEVMQAVFLGASIQYLLRCEGIMLRAITTGGMREVFTPGTRVALQAPETLHRLLEDEETGDVL